MDLRHKDEIYDPRLANHVDKDKVNFLNDCVYKDLVSIIAIRDCCKKKGANVVFGVLSTFGGWGVCGL